MRKLLTNIQGDTIIEVLVSIVVLGVILSGAFVTANNSLKTIREAQERVQAVGLAQAQLEDLRANAANIFAVSGNSSYATGTPFCFSTPTSISAATSLSCTNVTLSAGSVGYGISITGSARNSSQAALNINTNTFKVTVSWSGPVLDGSKSYAYLFYRIST